MCVVVMRRWASLREGRLARQHCTVFSALWERLHAPVLRPTRTPDLDWRRRSHGGAHSRDTRHHVAISSQRHPVPSVGRTDGREHPAVVATAPRALSCGSDQSSGLFAVASNQCLAAIRRVGGVRDWPVLRLHLGAHILLTRSADPSVERQPQSQHRRCQSEYRKNLEQQCSDRIPILITHDVQRPQEIPPPPSIMTHNNHFS